MSIDSTAVEFVSSYPDLQCSVSPELHARIAKTKKKNDDKVYVTIVTIPMSSIRVMKDQLRMLNERCRNYEKMFENYSGKIRRRIWTIGINVPMNSKSWMING